MAERNLLVDVYSKDLGGKPNWQAAADAPNVVGGIIKATEGTNFDTTWFDKNWPLLREVGGDRYGQTWFRGAYHFLKFNRDGVAQANFFLDAIDNAGGFDEGDIIPIVDVELGRRRRARRTMDRPAAQSPTGMPRPNRSSTARQLLPSAFRSAPATDDALWERRHARQVDHRPDGLRLAVDPALYRDPSAPICTSAPAGTSTGRDVAILRRRTTASSRITQTRSRASARSTSASCSSKRSRLPQQRLLPGDHDRSLIYQCPHPF